MAVYIFDQFSVDEDSEHHYIKRGKTAVYWGLRRWHSHRSKIRTDDEMIVECGYPHMDPKSFCDGEEKDKMVILKEVNKYHCISHKIYEPPLSLHRPGREWYILEVEK